MEVDLTVATFTADKLSDELDRICAKRGTRPAVLWCDNGPEFVCQAMSDCAGQASGLSFIPPGQPRRNGYIESFNGKLRDSNQLRYQRHPPTPHQ